MFDRKRFHPIVLIAYFIKSIKAFLVFIIIALMNIGTDPFFVVASIVGIVIFCLISSLIKYITHTYGINENKILMYNGIFIKKETEIPYERIQTIKQRQWFFYKPFNVVQILIETGSTSDNEAEASLLAVDASIIDVIEGYRHGSSNGKKVLFRGGNELSVIEDTYSENEEDDEHEIVYEYRMSHKDILLFALTDLNIFIVLIPVIAFIGEIFTEFNFVLDWIPEAVFIGIDKLMGQAIWLVIIFAVTSSLVLLMTISIIKNFFYYFEFTVMCSRKTITIEYGLFERKTQKIPLNKVQGIRTYQQVLRKIMGKSSVEVNIIGGQETKGESDLEERILILPLINSKKMYPALSQIFPNYATYAPTINYVGEGKLFYFWRWVILLAVPVIGIGFYFFTWLGVVLLIGTLVILMFQWLDFRYQGYAIIDKNLISIQNYVGFSKVQTFLNPTKIQAFDKSSSYLLLRKKIGHFNFHIKSGISNMSVGLRFVDVDHIDNIQRFFNRSKIN